MGRAYLRHIRKPLTAVQDLLLRRRDRERFCIPLYHFHSGVEELRWQRQALALHCSRKIHVGPNGLFETWQWRGQWGGEVPEDVIQWASDACMWMGGYQY